MLGKQFEEPKFMFYVPKYSSDHFHSDICNNPSPNAAIRESADKSALPTCCPCDRSISNDFHMIQGQSFSPILNLIKEIKLKQMKWIVNERLIEEINGT